MTRMETSSPCFRALFACKKCKAVLTWFTFAALVEVSGLIFMVVRSPLVLWRRLDHEYIAYGPFLLNSHNPFCFFLSLPIFRAWWTGAKWAVFLLFQQRGHLYSIPGSQVSYSAPLQVMSGPWKVLQINLSWCFEGNLTSMHSSFHSYNYKGIVRRKEEKKTGKFCSFLWKNMDYGNVMGKKIYGNYIQ